LPIILPTQEAEIRRIEVQSQHGQNRPHLKKKPSPKKSGEWLKVKAHPSTTKKEQKN
jgi:hypothetical protein